MDIHSDIHMFTPNGFVHMGDGVCHILDRQPHMPDADKKGNTDKFIKIPSTYIKQPILTISDGLGLICPTSP